MAPASHRPRGGARGRGTGRGKAGPGPRPTARPSRALPAPPGASWLPKFLRRGHGPGEPPPPGRRQGPGDRPGGAGERRARALGPRPALPRRSPRSPRPLAPPGCQSSSPEGMAPASHRPRGGARGRGTGRGAPGKGGPGPSAHGPPFPGAPRAPWRLLAAKVPPTRAWPRRATAPGEGPTKGPKGHKRGHRMSKGTQRPPKANQAAECQKVKRLQKVPKGTQMPQMPTRPQNVKRSQMAQIPRSSQNVKRSQKAPKGQRGHRMSKGQKVA